MQSNPQESADSGETPRAVANDAQEPDTGERKRYSLFRPPYPIWGFGLPLCAILMEAIGPGHLTRNAFDPIPTSLHLLFLCSVPLLHLAILFRLHSGSYQKQFRWPLQALSGIALGTCCVYCLAFIPIAPLGLMLVLIGIGILVLTPYFSAIATLFSILRGNLIPRTNLELCVFTIPLCLTIAGLVGIEFQGLHEREKFIALSHRAESLSGEELEQLRRDTSEATLEALALGTLPRNEGLFRKFKLDLDLDTEEQNRPQQRGPSYAGLWILSHRLTGRYPRSGFNHFAFSGGSQNNWNIDDHNRDVTADWRAKLPLELRSSRLDAAILSAEGIARLTWTMEVGFSSVNRFTREACLDLICPAEAVLSEATLWVDGQPREAVFGPIEDATRAYDDTVRAAIDPLLVTELGEDRIRIRAFPIPDHGTMRWRIGWTAPLFGRGDMLKLTWPEIVSGNVRPAEGLQHALWIESDRELQDAPKGLTREPREGQGWIARGSVAPNDLRPLRLANALKSGPIGLAPGLSENTPTIAVSWESEPITPPTQLVLAIDGGAMPQERWLNILRATQELGAERCARIVLCRDEPEVLAEDFATAMSRLRTHEPVGGPHLYAGLLKALELARDIEGSAVVWIHRPPFFGGSVQQELEQWTDRRDTKVYSVSLNQVVPHATAGLINPSKLIPLRLEGPFETALAVAMQEVVDTRPILRLALTAAETSDTRAPTLSDRHALLWANQEVRALKATGKKDRATALARFARILSPVTAAVVLETDRDYRRFDLEPPPPGTESTVPTIPEPHEWALIALAAAGLIGLIFWRKNQMQRWQGAA